METFYLNNKKALEYIEFFEKSINKLSLLSLENEIMFHWTLECKSKYIVFKMKYLRSYYFPKMLVLPVILFTIIPTLLLIVSKTYQKL